MAIRIDLLPSHVGLRRWFKRILAICLLLVGGFAAVLFLLYYKDQLRLQTLIANRENIRAAATAADRANENAGKAELAARPMQDAVSFMVDASRSGPERAALLDLIHRYVYAGSVVGSIDISDGQNVTMTAMVRTPDDYARFLLNLRRGTVPAGVLFSELPSAAGIQGWPNRSGAGQNQGAGQPAGAPGADGMQPGGTTGAAASSALYQTFANSINATAKLREPVVVPVPPGEAGTPAAGGGGMPGDPGAMGDPGAPPEP